MTAKLAIEDLRRIVDAARGLGSEEIGIAAQLFVDLLVSSDFSANALVPETFATLLQHRIERHRAALTPTSQALH